MAEPDSPQSPFAGMADLAARAPVRLLPPDEVERMLAEHRLYLETESHEGHRANFSSADLAGRDFSGLNLRGIKMDRAVLRGLISPELISKPRTSSAPLQSRRASTVRIYRGRV